MNILVIGAGGREHAISKTLASPKVDTVYCAPGNPGMTKMVSIVSLSVSEIIQR